MENSEAEKEMSQIREKKIQKGHQEKKKEPLQ